MTESHLVAEIALAITERCCSGAFRKRILTDATYRATEIAADIMRPLVDPGLWYWSVGAQVRESPRSYARRAVRYLIARCAQAGLSSPVAHPHSGSAEVGMLAGHGVTTDFGGGPLAVSRIERSLDRE